MLTGFRPTGLRTSDFMHICLFFDLSYRGYLCGRKLAQVHELARFTELISPHVYMHENFSARVGAYTLCMRTHFPNSQNY